MQPHWPRLRQPWRSAGQLTLLLLLVAGCAIGARPVPENQLQQFVADQQIQPLVVQEVDGVMTAIVFRKAKAVGCALLTNNQMDTLTSTATDGAEGNRADEPATAIYLDAFHNDVICVTINDAQLRQRTQVVQAVFFDGETMDVPVQNQEGFIISRRFDPGSTRKKLEVVLYDEHQQELYRVRVWT